MMCTCVCVCLCVREGVCKEKVKHVCATADVSPTDNHSIFPSSIIKVMMIMAMTMTCGSATSQLSYTISLSVIIPSKFKKDEHEYYRMLSTIRFNHVLHVCLKAEKFTGNFQMAYTVLNHAKLSADKLALQQEDFSPSVRIK